MPLKAGNVARRVLSSLAPFNKPWRRAILGQQVLFFIFSFKKKLASCALAFRGAGARHPLPPAGGAPY
jgi:hypothetical protein